MPQTIIFLLNATPQPDQLHNISLTSMSETQFQCSNRPLQIHGPYLKNRLPQGKLCSPSITYQIPVNSCTVRKVERTHPPTLPKRAVFPNQGAHKNHLKDQLLLITLTTTRCKSSASRVSKTSSWWPGSSCWAETRT